MAATDAVRRLAQYRPFEREGRDTRGAVRDLILASAIENGGVIESLGSCRETCQVLWGLEVELDEIRSNIKDLVEAGQLVPENGRYRIADAAGVEIEATLAASAEAEEQAFHEWELTVRAVTPGLSDADVLELRADLEVWLRQLIRRHGLEAALILYPESSDGAEMLKRLEGEGLDFLPARSPEIEAVRERAFFLFVTQPTEKQRTLLANLMHTAYFLTVLTLDPEAKQLIQDVARGQVVYLDTNILYRILNLNTPRAFLSAQRLLALTTDLGYVLAVTPWTVAELRHSLERARDYLKSKSLPPGELAALAAEATTDENFIVSYWRRIKDKPTSVDDFFDFYNEIEAHLAEHNIAVLTDGCQAVDRDEEHIAEEMSAIERVPGPRMKPEPVKEHDVKHRLLILRRRGESNRRFANAGFWFLTADSSLPRYDYVARGGGHGLPFCATASGWAQVMRSFVPRTADMDQTLTDLLSSPYIRYRGRIAYDTVREVASRLELFKGSTPGLAAAVLMNTALLRELAETPEEEARNELIDNAVVAAAADLERQLTEERTRAEGERLRRAQALRTVDDVAGQLADEQGQVTTLREQLEAERNEREREIEAAKTELEQERLVSGQAIDSVRSQLASLRRTLSLLGAAALAVVAAMGTAIPIHSGSIHGALPVSLLIAAGSLLVVAAAALVAGWRRVWIAFGVIAVVVGFVAAVFDLLRG